MKKVSYNTEPSEVIIEKYKDNYHIFINTDIKKVSQDAESEQWTAEMYDFWEKVDKINIDDVKANPTAFIGYVINSKKEEARQLAQEIVDNIRSDYPTVPIPSFRSDARICHRPADDIKLIGGLMLGGLTYYELASGEIVSLSLEHIQNILKDVAIWETNIQVAKQNCWDTINNAKSQDDVDNAIIKLKEVLHG